MALQTPNYTQVPNSLFEQMGDMSEAELKITLSVVRMTIGYHQECKRMSFTYLQQATGLSKSAVNKGIQEALGRGTVKRVPYKNSFEYHPNFASNAEERSTEATDNGSQKLPESVAENYSNKETSKKTKKNDRENLQKPVNRRGKTGRTRAELDELYLAVQECFFEPGFEGGYITKVRKRLMEVSPDITPTDIRKFWGWWQGKYPNCELKNLDKLEGYFRQWKYNGAVKSPPPPMASPVIHPVTLTDEQREDHAAKLAAEVARLQGRSNVAA